MTTTPLANEQIENELLEPTIFDEKTQETNSSLELVEPTEKADIKQERTYAFCFETVPPLPPPPAPKRYGDAALIPHEISGTLNIDRIIETAKKERELALQLSQQDQQRKNIEKLLEQRRLVLNSNKQ